MASEKELLNRIKKLEEKVERQQEIINSVNQVVRDQDSDPGNQQISRRDFLKALGAGAVGLGALSMIPSAASKLTITDNGISSPSGFDFIDSGSQYFKINDGGPVEVKNADLRIPTGKAIEDGGGNRRIDINSGRTLIGHDSKPDIIDINDGTRLRLMAQSDAPIIFLDSEGSFNAVKYLTSASAPGTLELTNANLNAKSNNISNVSSLDTEQADVTGETFIRGTRGSRSSSTSAGTFLKIADGESADVRGEFNTSQEFVPDKSGEYEVTAVVHCQGGNTAVGDEIDFIIKDGGGAQVLFLSDDAGRITPRKQFSLTVELSAGTTYQLEARNNESSFKLDTESKVEIKWSTVHD